MKIEYKKDGIVIDGTVLLLTDITSKCNDVKLKEDKLVILEMGWDGRGGEVFEQIALPLEKALQVKEILLGREVYFGEIWGKHSEVCGEMCEKTFEIIKDGKKIKSFLNNYPSGHNYDHSFIYTFLEREEERLEYEVEDLDEDDITQEELDELRSLIK